MKRKTKNMLLKSKKPTRDATSGAYSSDQEIEEHFAPLIRELNKVIQFTDAYRYGNFKFRVIVDSDQVPTIMVADTKWDKLFGSEIKRICRVFNIKAHFEEWTGFYYFFPLGNDMEDPEYNGSLWIKRIPYAIDNHKYGQR